LALSWALEFESDRRAPVYYYPASRDTANRDDRFVHGSLIAAVDSLDGF
jgi:hypothetical protein